MPDTIPSWVNNLSILDVDKLVSTSIQNNNAIDISTSKWEFFKLSKLFNIETCKCSNASELESGGDVFYLGAKKVENGVMRTVKSVDYLTTQGNCIVFICDGQGSVGYSNYMDREFIGSTTLSVGFNEKLNKFNALFIVTVLDLERPRYSFGRKYRNTLPNTKIKLPAITLSGLIEPDWKFMEDYIKQLRYSDKI